MELILLALGLGVALSPFLDGSGSSAGSGSADAAEPEAITDTTQEPASGGDLLDDSAGGTATGGQAAAAQPTDAAQDINGTWRWEKYWGGDNDDFMDLRGGNDFANGGAGSDTLQGGSGDDTLMGGSGDDTLMGGAGDDLLKGDAGDDVLAAGEGQDSVYGGRGDDTLWGGVRAGDALGDGQDYFDGGTGDDKIHGAAGGLGSTLVGGGGDDTIVAASSGNTLIGGRGDDVIDASLGNEVWLDGLGGGHGSDTLTIVGEAIGTSGEALAPMVVHDFQIGNDTLLVEGSENHDLTVADQGEDLMLYRDGEAWALFTGQAGASLAELMPDYLGRQLFEGSAEGDDLTGSAGDDTMSGGLGDDRLFGAAGADLLDGEDGNDVLLGGDGDDVLSGGAAGNDTLFGGGGVDTLIGGDGDDVLLDFGAGDEFYGGDGNDVLQHGVGGYLANTTRWVPLVTEGAATLDGGAGDDMLVGVSGDQMTGGEGSDRFVLDITGQGVAVVTDFDASSDVLKLKWGGGDFRGYLTLDELAAAGISVTQELTAEGLLIAGQVLLEGVDTLLPVAEVVGASSAETSSETAAAASDPVAGAVYTGTSGADTYYAGAGDDTLFGGDGDDLMWGASGDDLIEGEAGDDVLMAMSGADTLYGGDGDDRLFGSDIMTAVSLDQTASRTAYGDGNDYLDGGAGDDWIFATGVATTSGSTLVGGLGNDTLTAIYSGNTLVGGLGDDVVSAAIGNDVWLDDPDTAAAGETGSDSLTLLVDGHFAELVEPEPGPMVVHDFQVGIDQFAVDSQDSFVLSAEDQGDDLMIYRDGQPVVLLIGCAGTSLEMLLPDYAGKLDSSMGTLGDDAWTGTEGNDTFNGWTGADTLIGLGGNDYLKGGMQNDLILGGDGDDVLVGGPDTEWRAYTGTVEFLTSDSDTLFGGGGTDYLRGGDRGDVLLDYGAGDTMRGEGNQDELMHGVGGFLGDGSVWTPIITEGGAVLDGEEDVNILIGASGDTLWGGAGSGVPQIYILDITQPGIARVPGLDLDYIDWFKFNWAGSGLEGGYYTLAEFAAAGIEITQEVTDDGLLIAGKILLPYRTSVIAV